MLKKIAQKAKGRYSNKHGKNEKNVREKIAKGIPLTKTERESKVFAKLIKKKPQ